MTEGSFKTMPSPRAYTNVLAVPRSIARSRARTGPLGCGPLGRGPFGPGPLRTWARRGSRRRTRRACGGSLDLVRFDDVIDDDLVLDDLVVDGVDTARTDHHTARGLVLGVVVRQRT